VSTKNWAVLPPNAPPWLWACFQHSRFALKTKIHLLPHKCIKNDQAMLF